MYDWLAVKIQTTIETVLCVVAFLETDLGYFGPDS